MRLVSFSMPGASSREAGPANLAEARAKAQIGVLLPVPGSDPAQLTSARIMPLAAIAPDLPRDMIGLFNHAFAGGSSLAGYVASKIALEAGKTPSLAVADVHLWSPIPRPGKILAIGQNYLAHIKEMGREPPAHPVWFNKQVTAANGPFDAVELPVVSEQLDYEVELVFIIGRYCRHVPVARAMEVIAGFCVGCDFSVRDWQKQAPTMILGKGFDTHAPFGPALVTPDEISDIGALRVQSFVNGEKRQDSLVSDMMFGVAEQIAHLSLMCTLEPGDVIFTGTPSGVAAGRTPPLWLRVGDRVRCEISQLGAIENPIVAGGNLPLL